MNYCSHCGNTVKFCTPAGDDRPRYLCESCGTVHYENPKIVVGCIPEKGRKILLCRRAIEPRSGKWTLPAGYLENGETVAQGARRETLEEAGAKIEILAPYALFNICYVNQIYLMFRARLLDDVFKAGSESSDVRLFLEEDIPWDQIAFTVIEETLRLYFKDRPAAAYPFHIGDILSEMQINTVEY
ncbi:MAG: NUDIX hydrolase [Desulfobacterales bacterium]|jgi:ADP-ribose pyrophosphatase YjhB (NUDIX family)